MYYTTYITKQTQQISYTDLFNSEYNPQAINSTVQKYKHTLQIPTTQFKVNKLLPITMNSYSFTSIISIVGIVGVIAPLPHVSPYPI